MLLPFIWIAAFFFSLPLVEPYEIARLLGVLCAGGAFVYAFWTGAAGLPRSPVLAVAGLFWVLTGISVAFSAVPFVSFVAFCSFSLLPLSALCFLCAPDRVRAINRAAAGAGVILAALALWAVGQYLFVPDMLVYGQVRYPFANPNSYAALMAAGVFPALGVMCSAGTRNVRIAAGALAVLLLVAVMVIGGRAVPLALVAVLIVFVMMVPRLSWRGRGGIVLLMAGAMALGTAIAVMGGAAAIARLDHNMLGTALFGRG
ncbi:MAG: hypothetical protein KJ667_06195, partial [Alphaproteobacteria bacterium]|nr:hypothetical protein [Alphaproteobacteria bacterium]